MNINANIKTRRSNMAGSVLSFYCVDPHRLLRRYPLLVSNEVARALSILDWLSDVCHLRSIYEYSGPDLCMLLYGLFWMGKDTASHYRG